MRQGDRRARDSVGQGDRRARDSMGQGDRWAETVWDRETGRVRKCGTGRQVR